MAHIKPMLLYQTREDAFMSPLGYLKVHVKLISHGSLSTISSAIWSSVPGHILGGRWVYCSVTLPFVITDSVVGWCTSLIIYGMFHYLQVEYRKASTKINNSFFLLSHTYMKGNNHYMELLSGLGVGGLFFFDTKGAGIILNFRLYIYLYYFSKYIFKSTFKLLLIFL